MKFWEFNSIFSDEQKVLDRILKGPAWVQYLHWRRDYAEHVGAQNRSVLDAMMPDDLCREVLAESAKRFVVVDGQLTSYLPQHAEAGCREISAVEAFDMFGGSAIEEVCEKGAYLIPK